MKRLLMMALLACAPAHAQGLVEAMPLPGTEVPHTLAPAYVRGVQERLKRNGLYSGLVNGHADAPGFLSAIARYQTRVQLPLSGEMDEKTTVSILNGVGLDR